jgi:hypothetical protein
MRAGIVVNVIDENGGGPGVRAGLKKKLSDFSQL